jgi:hypothetical protein
MLEKYRKARKKETDIFTKYIKMKFITNTRNDPQTLKGRRVRAFYVEKPFLSLVFQTVFYCV